MAPARLPWPALEGYDPLPGLTIEAWLPPEAKAKFLSRFQQLFTDS